MFFYEVEGHIPKLSSFGRGKKIRPKKSPTSFWHAALQLQFNLLTTAGIMSDNHTFTLSLVLLSSLIAALL